MTIGHMRRLPPSTSSLSAFRRRSLVQDAIPRLASDVLGAKRASPSQPPSRSLAQIRNDPLAELWFTSSGPTLSAAGESFGPGSNGNHKPPDARTLKLGKTLRTLSPLLPNILRTPLPPEILSPSIVLHLFPSTHPHLPSVRGKVPYRAALWTAPVAWGTVPIVGNVKIRVLSEKILRTGHVTEPSLDSSAPCHSEEKLVVRWKTEISPDAPSTANSTAAAASTSSSSSDSHHNTSGNGGLNRTLSSLLGGDKPIFSLNADSEFSGLFIFSFDDEGRIASHTIEHADENNGCDRTSKVVTLTDWLLGKARWKRAEEEMIPGLAMRVCRNDCGRPERGEKDTWH